MEKKEKRRLFRGKMLLYFYPSPTTTPHFTQFQVYSWSILCSQTTIERTNHSHSLCAFISFWDHKKLFSKRAQGIILHFASFFSFFYRYDFCAQYLLSKLSLIFLLDILEIFLFCQALVSEFIPFILFFILHPTLYRGARKFHFFA
jgi:hypothetical protein